jgi:hypothetical protein
MESSTTTRAAEIWGPLAQPTHSTVPEGDGTSAWKDNAYVSFWDEAQQVFGTLHVSTSPNAEGRRARMSLSVDGRLVEVIEELAPASFQSESIEFDLDGRISVDSPELTVDLHLAPRLALGDYTPGAVIPPMGGAPVHHYQRTVDVTGTCRLKGRDLTINATGIRDRTWGYRDESVNIKEYFWFFATFPDFSITAMRFFADDVPERTDGFVLRENDVQSVRTIGVVRDASGLCAEAIFGLEGGDELRLRSQGRQGGFWIPMSWERHGPTMSAYDEFCPFTTPDGTRGYGVAEHGNVRQLY